MGRAQILVSEAGKEVTAVECDHSSDTLTLTTTADRMTDVGISAEELAP